MTPPRSRGMLPPPMSLVDVMKAVRGATADERSIGKRPKKRR